METTHISPELNCLISVPLGDVIPRNGIIISLQTEENEFDSIRGTQMFTSGGIGHYCLGVWWVRQRKFDVSKPGN